MGTISSVPIRTERRPHQSITCSPDSPWLHSHSSQPGLCPHTERRGRFEQFASVSTLLGCDTQTARHHGRIKNQLRAKGRPLPENDLRIAAVARQHALTLVTRDKHFSEIDDLPTVGGTEVLSAKRPAQGRR